MEQRQRRREDPGPGAGNGPGDSPWSSNGILDALRRQNRDRDGRAHSIVDHAMSQDSELHNRQTHQRGAQ